MKTIQILYWKMINCWKAILGNICLVILFYISGTSCMGMVDSRVIKQASFDHDCPEEQISVILRDIDIIAYKLNVCGKIRKYRDLGDHKQLLFIDVTDGMPSSSKIRDMQ